MENVAKNQELSTIVATNAENVILNLASLARIRRIAVRANLEDVAKMVQLL